MIAKSKIITFAVSILFIFLLFSPSIQSKEPVNRDNLLTIWMPEITEDDYFTQISVSNEQKQTFIAILGDVLDVINSSMAPGSPEGLKITYEEWQTIGIVVNEFIDSIRSLDENFPDIDIRELISNLIEGFFRPFTGFLLPEPMFSAGISFTWIPFYGYESFIGVMLRPMFTRHIFGYSRVGGILGRFYKIGTYSMFLIRFIGIFINFGDIGKEFTIGPTMYLGTVFFSRM